MIDVSRHWAAIREALAADRARLVDRTAPRDTDFLPAALEIIEQPVSPTARLTAWVLLVGLLLLVLWLVFGRVDMVASAPGKVMPTDDVKLVQATSSGTVRAIHVHDGDHVRRGQALIDLDPTLSGADVAQAEKALLTAELDAARNRAIADALAGKGMHFTPPTGTPPEVIATQQRLIEAQLAGVAAGTASLAAARDSALADAKGASAQIAKLGETVPILDREIAAMNQLDAKGYAPGLRLLELKRQRRSEAGDLDVAQSSRARGLSEARRLDQQSLQAREDARHTALTDLAKAESDAILRREEVVKASRRSHLQRLLAPVDGTVQQSTQHTIGGVVEPVRPLMVIVPDDGGLIVEAKLRNRDAGFVQPGQPVAIKLDAFPFTRYGTVPGHIISISSNAVPDPKLGAVYFVRIALARASIAADGRQVPLFGGLTVTADIRTGSRSLLSYLLSPIEGLYREAGRER